MNVVLNIVTVIFLVFVWHSETTKIGQALQSLFRQRPYDDGHMKNVNNHWCTRAKICHKMVGHPVCGVDPKRRQKRMFRNACSLYKHNCGRMHDFQPRNWKECSSASINQKPNAKNKLK
ncbi:uncharacterized protein LOC124640537 [Helicoverpa zea]|uniref:uncharacterized protein LOC124640537 n=1 Tax=Helicoverpa zea TaxID=7113 RepID=UPI001F57DCBC|nr:uncharacterized protein LOC124640537 [Helicoverpa zea]